MNASNDWRGIHPGSTLFRRWFVAESLGEHDSGSFRFVRACFTRRGAERKIVSLYETVRHNNAVRAQALLEPIAMQFELVGHLRDHPRAVETG